MSDHPTDDTIPPGTRLWSDAELAAALDTYLAMLRLELAGKPYFKSEFRNKLLSAELSARNPSSYELRMPNISAVFFARKLPIIAGYLPRGNVGTGVTERLNAMLDERDISDLTAYVPTADRATLEKRVAALAKQGMKLAPPGQMRPAQVTTTSPSFVRDPAVKRWVLDLADGKCEGCDCPAPFVDDAGAPFLEVHHVMPLASWGSDRVSNAVALCPNCHRRCHYSVDREEFKAGLYQKLPRLVPDVSDDTDEGTQVFI